MINLFWQLWNLPSLTPGKRGQKTSALIPSLCCLTHSSKFSLHSGEVQASQPCLLGLLLQRLLAFSLTLHYGNTTALGLWRRGLFHATCTLTQPVAPLPSPGCLGHPGGLSWSISSSGANCPSSHHALVSSCGSVPV